MTTRRQLIWVAVMFALTLASAVAVVYAKHASRRLFLEQERLRSEKERLGADWWRLQLEQGTWADHRRIVQMAQGKLNMRSQDPKEIFIIRP